MQESKQQTEQSTSYKTLKEQCSTSETSWSDMTFCRGGCDEIERLEDACAACKAEWHDYWSERNSG